MSIKKITSLLLIVLSIMQVCVVYAYDVMEDDELRQRWEEFGDKYTYDFQKQEEIYAMYPNLIGAIATHRNSDGTIDVTLGFYYDEQASLVGEDTFTQTTVVVNEQEECPGVIFNDRTLVEVSVFEKVGCQVATDQETLITSISRDGVTIELMPYLLDMRINEHEGYWIPLEICSRYIGDNNEHYVPLRAISRELGLSVDWDNNKRMASLKSE